MITPDTTRRDRAISLAIAVAVHAVALIGGTFWVSPVEYGVEAGDGGVEVHLVAALPAPLAGNPAVTTSAEAASEVKAENPAELPPVFEPIAQPMPETPKEAPLASPVGDGSSLIPGKDTTTFHSSGGARTSAGPSYFRNPAPAYPAAARDNGYEGMVLLRAEVMPNGRCGQLTVIQSSGYAILDQAAAQAIQRWRFKPASRAGAAIASWVEIPVRFDLLDSGEGS